jgi:hypothetical protein
MRVRVTCSAPLPVTTDAASAPGTAPTTLAAPSGQLGRCDSIVAIVPQEPLNP